MKIAAEYFLSFLLNASWQVALVAVVASFADLLLRGTVVRYRHRVWVVALLLSLALPLLTSMRPLLKNAPLMPTAPPIEAVAPVVVADIPESNTTAVATTARPRLEIGVGVAAGLLTIFLVFLSYRAVRFARAWARTRAAKHQALPFDAGHRVHAIVSECRRAIATGQVTLVNSSLLSTPATVGIFRPLIILPEALAREATDEELTAAVGHELVHVWRRDYLLNLIYEFIFLPLSFHPAAVLMRRRITQTRELRCDELVTELLLQPEIYARSLVQLARSAMPLARRARTVAVGIADADILEVRVMSLLKKTTMNASKKKAWLIAAALLMALPCLVAGAFAVHLNISAAQAQEPSREQQEKRELRSRREQEIKAKMQRQAQELEQAIKNETNPEMKAKFEKRLAELREQMDKPITVAANTEEGGYVLLKVDEARAREEREQQEKQRAVLVKLAKISMDQAIQIATSQTPGKVLECSLVGERWKGPGELAQPSQVLYHVVILSGDEVNPVTYHVLVNAVDGSVWKTEKEERKRESPEARTESGVEQSGWAISEGNERKLIRGGVLNEKAISLPVPRYPEIARAAKASGSVTVEVTIDETGHVVEARAVSGHPLLQAAAVDAARQAVFAPTRLQGEPVKVAGALSYKFTAQ
jgi:TonB family protein